MAHRAYPVGKAQAQVLEALGLTAADFTEANRIFEELGLVVTSKRQGRQSVPVVQVLDRTGGGFNAEGEGETWSQYPGADFSAIEQWIE